MKFKRNNILVVLFCLVFVAGCGKMVKRNAIKSVADIFINNFSVFTSEEDYVLAESGIGANLKFLDVLIAEEPDNEKLLSLAAKSYALYTFFFVEGKLLYAQNEGEEKVLVERAEIGYKKAILYGKRAMKAYNESLWKAFKKDGATFEQALAKDKFNIDSVFWLAYSLGTYSKINPNDPSVLLDLGKAKVIMSAVIKQNEHFFYGGAHLFFAVYYASTPLFAGGDHTKAAKYFESAGRINKGKLLLVPYLNARYYAEATLDRKLFEEKLTAILSAKKNMLPSVRLANVLSKRWAAALLQKVDDIF